MIRINLAPVEARRTMPSMSLSVPSFNLGILFGLLYIVAIGGLGFYWYGLMSEESSSPPTSTGSTASWPRSRRRWAKAPASRPSWPR